MRALSLGKVTHPAGVVVLCCAALGSASADVGGGKGYPATPWRHSAPESVQDIEKAKTAAAEYQTLSLPLGIATDRKMEIVRVTRVSLRPEKSREGDTVGYALVGKLGSSEETVSLSFSQIESFTVTSKNDEKVTLSVTVWPDISPRELFEKQPTYKQLVAGYRRNVVLVMGLRSADGRPLVFSGASGQTLLMEKLAVGTKGDFYGEHPHSVHPLRFWWAIPSVANDADYPYRLIPMASSSAAV